MLSRIGALRPLVSPAKALWRANGVRCMGGAGGGLVFPQGGTPRRPAGPTIAHVGKNTVVVGAYYENNEIKMEDGTVVKLSGNMVIPSGSWAENFGKMDRKRNMYLGISFAVWAIVFFFAYTKYGLAPSAYFPLCICRDTSVNWSHMDYTPSKDHYFQNYDNRMNLIEEDEE